MWIMANWQKSPSTTIWKSTLKATEEKLSPMVWSVPQTPEILQARTTDSMRAMANTTMIR